MSIITNRAVNTDLNEELQSLGIRINSSDMKVLSEGSDGGTFFSGSLFQNKDNVVESDVDPLDSDYVTPELMDRLEALDFDLISEDDLDELMSALGEKEMPDDAELFERVSGLVGDLTERKMRRRKAGKSGFEMVNVATAAERAKNRRRRNRGPAKAKARRARAKRERAPSAVARRGARIAEKERKKQARMSRRRNRRNEGVDLANELRGMANERNYGDYSESIERIGRVMNLISEWIDSPEVDEVLSESYENLTDLLVEGEEDFSEAVRPCLAIIKRCLEVIDAGN